jgi:hypothetical protein
MNDKNDDNECQKFIEHLIECLPLNKIEIFHILIDEFFNLSLAKDQCVFNLIQLPLRDLKDIKTFLRHC